MKILGDNGIKRPPARKAEDNKKRLDCKDMVDMFVDLDKQKVILPTFFAVNLAKIPGVRPIEGDIMAINASLYDMKLKMDNMQKAFEADRKSLEYKIAKLTQDVTNSNCMIAKSQPPADAFKDQQADLTTLKAIVNSGSRTLSQTTNTATTYNSKERKAM